MAEDAISGRVRDAVEAELARVRHRFGGSSRKAGANANGCIDAEGSTWALAELTPGQISPV
jgi:hypothetical protein